MNWFPSLSIFFSMKKLEMVKTKTTFVLSVLKVDITIFNFFLLTKFLKEGNQFMEENFYLRKLGSPDPKTNSESTNLDWIFLNQSDWIWRNTNIKNKTCNICSDWSKNFAKIRNWSFGIGCCIRSWVFTLC